MHGKNFVLPRLSLLLLVFLVISVSAYAQGGNWKVWVKTSPCSGRNDWITVAKEDPTGSGGSNFYSSANMIFPGTECTGTGCNFDKATRIANSLRLSGEFSKYCCRDYSVWQNSGTGKMSVIVGKFGTAGAGWQLVKGDLCCEEAEAISGIAGACSGTRTNNNNQPPAVKCYPGSHAMYNKQTKRTECFCDPGLVWNDTKTACVTPPVRCWPGSHAEYNSQTQRTECFCDAGLVWNADKTACITPAVQCYPGSHAAYNPQTKRTECFCDAGLVWNDTKTACVTPAVQCYPGSHAAYNPQTQRTECFCDAGLVWNASKTACIPPKQKNNNNNNNNNNGNGATWSLVSVTSEPSSPGPGWQFNTGGTAHIDVYNGDKGDFNWTPPPQSFNSSGFTLSLGAQAKPVVPTGPMSLLIQVKGYGMRANLPSDQLEVYANTPKQPSVQRSISFTPDGAPSEINVEIGMMWGAVKITYKYRKN